MTQALKDLERRLVEAKGPDRVLDFYYKDAEALADAHLAAAAPEMKEALRVALGHMTGGLDGDYRDCDPVDVVRAALAKSEGRNT